MSSSLRGGGGLPHLVRDFSAMETKKTLSDVATHAAEGSHGKRKTTKYTRDHALTDTLQSYITAGPEDKPQSLRAALIHIQTYKQSRHTNNVKKVFAGFVKAFLGKKSLHLPAFERKTQLVERIEGALQLELAQLVQLSEEETQAAFQDCFSVEAREQGADSASKVMVGSKYVSKTRRSEFAASGGLVTVSPMERQSIKEQLMSFTCGTRLIMPKSKVVVNQGQEIFLEEKMLITTSTPENIRIYLEDPGKFDNAAIDLVNLSKHFIIGDITQPTTTTSTNYLEMTSIKTPRWDNLPLQRDGSIAFFDTDQVRPREEGDKSSVLDIIRFFPYSFDKIMQQATRLGLDVNPKEAAIVQREALAYYDVFRSTEALRDKPVPTEIFHLESKASPIEQSIHAHLAEKFAENHAGKPRSINTFTEFRLEKNIAEIVPVLRDMKERGKISAFQVNTDEFEETHCNISIVV